jgi:aspartate/glutamate racemase
MHIGLIGGIGPAATDYYYRGLLQLHADAGRPLDLTIVHARYGRISAATIVLPVEHPLDLVHRAYVEMATTGRVTDRQREVFFSVGRELCRAHGAEAVILGGTDPFLAFNGHDCGFEVVDAASVHVAAIYQRSTGHPDSTEKCA